MLALVPIIVATTLWFTTHTVYGALAGANASAILCFGLDKLKAIRKSKRIREADLLVLSVLCPFGSLLGMAAFRHKTTRQQFWVVPSLAAAAQAVGVFYWRWSAGKRTEAAATLAVMVMCVFITSVRELIR